MKAIELLEAQHAETLQALNTLEESKPGAERKETFKTMQAGLLAHMVIEEELFYPAVSEKSDSDGEPIAEGYEEHSGARVALDRCARALSEKELFGVRIMVLKEMIKHHIAEERGEIFPRAKKALKDDELESLGEKMEARFEQAKKQANPTAKLDRLATSRAKAALV